MVFQIPLLIQRGLKRDESNGEWGRIRERAGGRRAEERTEMKGAGRRESDGEKGKEKCAEGGEDTYS